jgi:endoglucanase
MAAMAYHCNCIFFAFSLLLAAGNDSFISLTPIEMQKRMGFGINLGNQLELMKTPEKRMPKEAYFDAFKQAGFTNVRVPVRWDKHTGKESPYTIDKDWLDSVEKVIDWSLARGLVTIVNTHHETWLDTPWHGFENKLPRLEAIWTQLAERFAGKSENLLFEIYNEPHLMGADHLNEVFAACLPIIRKKNPTRIVLISGLKFMNPSWILANGTSLAIPNDKQLMLEIHNYDPFSYAGSDATQHSWGSASDRAALDKWVSGIDTWSKKHGLPIYYGEFAVTTEQTPKTGSLDWYKAHYEAITSHGWAASVWSDGNQHLLFDYQSGEWAPNAIDILKVLGRVPPNTTTVSSNLII